MTADGLSRYIEIKQQISALEKELEELKDDVFSNVDGQGGEVTFGNCTVRSYKNPKYKFSDNYDKMNAEVKELRKKEIEDGTAKIDGYSEYVRLTFKKGD